jgi:hypothetical protein
MKNVSEKKNLDGRGHATTSSSSSGKQKNRIKKFTKPTVQYIDVEMAPFDEPPLSREWSLDRLVEALKSGSPIPEVTAVPRTDESTIESLTHASGLFDVEKIIQERRKNEKKKSKKTKQRNKENGTTKKSMEIGNPGKEVKLARQIRDIVDSSEGDTQNDPSVHRQHRRHRTDEEDDDEEETLLTQDNSLEYFLSREWLSKSAIGDDEGEELNKKDACGVCAFFDLSAFSNKQFTVPISWKDYTSLEAACFNNPTSEESKDEKEVPFCRSGSWISCGTNGHSLRSVVSEEEGTRNTWDDSQPAFNNLFPPLPPLESYQEVFGRFFDGPGICGIKRKLVKKKKSTDSVSLNISDSLGKGADSDGTVGKGSPGLKAVVASE